MGLFLNMPMYERDGAFSARYPHLFDFFFDLSERTESADLCVPLLTGAEARSEYGAVEPWGQARIVGLPHWSSARMVVRRIHRILPRASAVIVGRGRRWDVVGAVTPSVVGNLFILVARLRRQPVFLLIRGEKQRTVELIMGSGLRTRPYLWALRLMERMVRRWIAAGVPAFVAGSELVDRYEAAGGNVVALYPGLSSDFPLLDAKPPEVAPRPALPPGYLLPALLVPGFCAGWLGLMQQHQRSFFDALAGIGIAAGIFYGLVRPLYAGMAQAPWMVLGAQIALAVLLREVAYVRWRGADWRRAQPA